LVERDPQGRATVYDVQDHPARTNLSGEPLLCGWCGETNNVGLVACGMVRVERVARNGRVYVTPIHGAELADALAELGYPELAPELADELEGGAA
jgi:hypothetical protein